MKILARGWTVEINTGTDAAPNWVKIGGLTSLDFGGDKSDADVTDFDSNGNEEHIVASRSVELGLEGNYLENKSDGTRDPGQEAVEELAEQIGEDSLGQFRLTSPGGNTFTFMGSASVGGIGGGVNDPTAWTATITRSGPTTKGRATQA